MKGFGSAAQECQLCSRMSGGRVMVVGEGKNGAETISMLENVSHQSRQNHRLSNVALLIFHFTFFLLFLCVMFIQYISGIRCPRASWEPNSSALMQTSRTVAMRFFFFFHPSEIQILNLFIDSSENQKLEDRKTDCWIKSLRAQFLVGMQKDRLWKEVIMTIMALWPSDLLPVQWS